MALLLAHRPDRRRRHGALAVRAAGAADPARGRRARAASRSGSSQGSCSASRVHALRLVAARQARAAAGPAAEPRDRAPLRDGGRAARAAGRRLVVERRLSAFSRLRPANAGGGFLLGVTLGLVFVPVRRAVARRRSRRAAGREQFGGRTFAATLAYAIGAAIPMLVIAYRRPRGVAARIRSHARAIRDGVRRRDRARRARRSSSTPTTTSRRSLRRGRLPAGQGRGQLERGKRELAKLRGGGRARVVQKTAGDSPTTASRPRSTPTATGSTRKPLTLAQLRGKVVADRLLDLLVHQLPAHAAAPEGVGRDLPQAGARDHRRPHARSSPSSTSHRTCAPRCKRLGDHVPGRAGQPLQDVGQLLEPVLARGVPDRQRPATCGTRTSARAQYGETEQLIRTPARRARREVAADARHDADGAR